MTSMNEAVGILQYLIEGKFLSSKTDQYVNQNFRNPAFDKRADVFYTRTLDAHGIEAAETQLDEWIKCLHLREFSEAIEPIALGLFNLAQVETKEKYVVISRNVKKMPYEIASRVGEDGLMIIALLPEWQGCGCSLPEGGDVFSQYGELSLQAIVIGVSVQNEVILGLIFKDVEMKTEFGITAITIERSGYSHNTSFAPRFKKDGFLHSSLGIAEYDNVYGIESMSGGSMGMYLGFPDSDIYLAKHIGKLGPYLSSMAEHMKKHQN